MVAPIFSDAPLTNSTASLVVICSNTTLKPGKRRVIGTSTLSIKIFSLSKTSTSVSFISPCTNKGIFSCSIASSTEKHLAISVTPVSEYVVVQAG